jgi:hypothetical protein
MTAEAEYSPSKPITREVGMSKLHTQALVHIQLPEIGLAVTNLAVDIVLDPSAATQGGALTLHMDIPSVLRQLADDYEQAKA